MDTPKLITWHRPSFGDTHTAESYDKRVRATERELTAQLVVAPDCAFVVEHGKEKRTYSNGEAVPPGALLPNDIERLVRVGVLLRATPERLRAVEAESAGAPYRVARGRALTLLPAGGSPSRLAGEGEQVLAHEVGGERNLRHLVTRGLVDGPMPPPEAA